MELYKKLLKRIESDLPIYDNIEYAKDLEAIANKHFEEQLTIPRVSSSRYDFVINTQKECNNLSKKYLLLGENEETFKKGVTATITYLNIKAYYR